MIFTLGLLLTSICVISGHHKVGRDFMILVLELLFASISVIQWALLKRTPLHTPCARRLLLTLAPRPLPHPLPIPVCVAGCWLSRPCLSRSLLLRAESLAAASPSLCCWGLGLLAPASLSLCCWGLALWPLPLQVFVTGGCVSQAAHSTPKVQPLFHIK